MNQPRIIWIAASIAVAGAAIGCAATQVSTDHDPAAPFQNYRTFKVMKGKVVQDGVVDRGNTLVTDRINNAVTANLQQKGLKPVDPQQAQAHADSTHHLHGGHEDDSRARWRVGRLWLVRPELRRQRHLDR